MGQRERRYKEMLCIEPPLDLGHVLFLPSVGYPRMVNCDRPATYLGRRASGQAGGTGQYTFVSSLRSEASMR